MNKLDIKYCKTRTYKLHSITVWRKQMDYHIGTGGIKDWEWMFRNLLRDMEIARKEM